MAKSNSITLDLENDIRLDLEMCTEYARACYTEKCIFSTFYNYFSKYSGQFETRCSVFAVSLLRKIYPSALPSFF